MPLASERGLNLDRLNYRPGRWLLTLLGVATLVYSIVVLGYAVSSPDLRLRCLIASPEANGCEIRALAPDFEVEGPIPVVGDRLVAIAREPLTNFLDFTSGLAALRSQADPDGADQIHTGIDLRADGPLLPPTVKRGSRRWTELQFFDRSAGQVETTWVRVNSLPWQEITLSLAWFILQSGIFAIAALAFWKRPFDQQAQLFYAVCVVQLGAFVGGYHWWLISASVWLVLPFICCALLLPVVTLHFFLGYPEPKGWMRLQTSWPRIGLYAVPVVAGSVLLAIVVWANWLHAHGAAGQQVQQVLNWLDQAIQFYFLIAAVYFAGSLAALTHSFFSIRNPIIHHQVKWILAAGLIATLPVGYTLYLAKVDEVGFALGRGSWPMFCASLLFMVAYAVGIARYKLMLVEELLSRGMVYVVVNALIATLFGMAVSATAIAGAWQNQSDESPWLAVMVIVCAAVIVLGWLRGRLQSWLDRRFFREKFRLDRALPGIHQLAGQVIEPERLAERMLTSCRDALQVDHSALYLRDTRTDDFQLVAVEKLDPGPIAFPTNQELLAILEADAARSGRSDDLVDGDSPAHRILRDLNVELVHVMASESGVLGLVLLGPKRNGASFTDADLAFLEALGQITSVALHSSKMQVAFSRMNDELQRKSEKQAEQQRLISMLQSELTTRKPLELTVAPRIELPAGEESDVTPEFRRDAIKGSSPAVVELLNTVRKVARSDSSVLIRGESGTGKELVARALHDNSHRRNGPLVSVHCGALSAGLLESELFGHVKGAFTGAHKDRIGRFEMAHGGTLFLDEIGDISMDTQIKLLRVLQEREFEPVGSARTVEVDVRLISATHQNLERLIAEGKFREDLFFRLNVITLTSPPLRERGDDVFELALHFLMLSAARHGKPVTHFDERSVEAIRNYPWPGNIRELENAIERAVVLAESSSVTWQDLPQVLRESSSPRPIRTGSRSAGDEMGPYDPSSFRETAGSTPVASSGRSGPRLDRFVGGIRTFDAEESAEDVERAQLVDALSRCGGNKAEAARFLGIPRSTLFSRLKKHFPEQSKGKTPPRKG